MVLIQAHVAAGDVATAKLVYDSMQRGGYDPRCGWLMLTCELFRRGCAACTCSAGARMQQADWKAAILSHHQGGLKCACFLG